MNANILRNFLVEQLTSHVRIEKCLEEGDKSLFVFVEGLPYRIEVEGPFCTEEEHQKWVKTHDGAIATNEP